MTVEDFIESVIAGWVPLWIHTLWHTVSILFVAMIARLRK
jgi:hypothetical protein